MSSWPHIVQALEAHATCVRVTVAAVEGSAPREAGAWIVVTPKGFHGSIGGGMLEWQAISKAQSMLGKPAHTDVRSQTLGPDLGQCCGGRVQLRFEVFDAGSLEAARTQAANDVKDRRSLYLFGAGHVGRALVLALAPLPFQVTWIDSRSDAFPSHVPTNVITLHTYDPASQLKSARPASFALVMTHSHALDFEIVDAALRLSHFAYVGLIGSATKRARFERRLRDGNVPPQRIAELVCPIGVTGITSKHPSSIALATAAQILMREEALRAVAQQPIAAKLQPGKRA